MNKKTIALISIPLLIAVVLGAFFLFKGGSDAYLQALPREVTALARMDAKAFIREANLSMTELAQLMDEHVQADEELRLGLDLKRPVYAFVAQSGSLGAVAAVADENDLTATCQRGLTNGLMSEVIHQRGYSWVVVKQQWLLAFDSQKALLMGPAVGAAQDQLRNEMAHLLEQDKSESVQQSPLYAALHQADEPLAAVLSPELFSESGLAGDIWIPSLLRKLKVFSADDALLRLALEADEHELTLDMDVLAQSDDVKAELNQLKYLLRPVKGSLIDYSHTDHVAWMTANVEGSKILEILRSNPSIRTALIALNLVIDLDRIIRAVDGDLALELTDTSSNVSSLYLTAKVTNTDFLSNVSSWGNDMFGVRSLSAQDFAMNFDSSDIFFGVDDDIFYVGGQRGLTSEKNEYLCRERSNIKGSRFFATFAIEPLLEQMQLKNDLPASWLKIERLNIEIAEPNVIQLKLMTPEGTNILRSLFQLSTLNSQLSTLNS